MANPLLMQGQRIDEILAARDSYTANRLVTQYHTSNDKEAFIAALIGRLLLEISRRESTAPGGVS